MPSWSDSEKKRARDLLNGVRLLKTDRDLAWYRTNVIDKIVKNKARYFAVEKSLGVPAALTAMIHCKEDASDLGKFKSYIGNGQPINKKTTIVPKNRGPFMSWEDGVIDAFTLKGYEKFKKSDWTLERVIYELERYNGFGYRSKGVNTPYVWNFTNHYSKGHYVSDGKYDANAVAKNIGAYAVYLLLIIADKDFDLNVEKEVKPVKQETQPVKQEESESGGFMDAIKKFFDSILNALFSNVEKAVVSVPHDKDAESVKVIAPTSQEYFLYKGTPSGNKKLEPDLISWFLSRLKNNPAYKEAVRTRDARTICFLAAQCSVGVREVGGNNKGREVEWFQETIGKAQSEAWCMSFVQSCIAFAEYVTGIQSPVFASEHCMATWNNTPKEQRVKHTPLKGAIVIWRHGSSTSGHTGILESCDEKEFTAYEGNTEGGFNSSGAVVRDGGGVYYTKRNRIATGNMKVVGFLKPF